MRWASNLSDPIVSQSPYHIHIHPHLHFPSFVHVYHFHFLVWCPYYLLYYPRYCVQELRLRLVYKMLWLWWCGQVRVVYESFLIYSLMSVSIGWNEKNWISINPPLVYHDNKLCFQIPISSPLSWGNEIRMAFLVHINLPLNASNSCIDRCK